MGQSDSAFAHIRLLNRLEPNYAPGLYALGNLYVRIDQPDSAAAAYRASLERMPRFPQAENNLGAVLERQGRFDEALEHYRRALDVDPAYKEARNNLTRLGGAGGAPVTTLDEALRDVESPASFPWPALAAPRWASRALLWVHLDRKEAALALAGELPIAADPRGSRFGGLETPVRGLVVTEAAREAEGALRLTLAPDPDEPAAAELVVEAAGRRVNMVLRSRPEGTVLWALHRDETEPSSPPPPGFHPPRVWVAESEEERAGLKERIGGAFRRVRGGDPALPRCRRAYADPADEALEGDRVLVARALLPAGRGLPRP